MFYVYALLDPRKDNQPFYIGKGSGNRLNDHLGSGQKNTKNRFKHSVVKAIRDSGLEPESRILFDGLDEVTAYDKEAELIKFYGRRNIDEDGILTNICIDSRPPSALGRKRSQETRQRISASNKGKSRGAGEANPMFGKTGASNPNFGSKRTEAQKTNMSEWQQRTYSFTSPAGKIHTITSANLQKFCKIHSMTYSNMMAAMKAGRIYKGWAITRE